MIPIAGFLPDLEPTTDGVITSCGDLIPTIKGSYEGAPTPVDVNIDPLADPCLGIAQVLDLSGAPRLYAGTDTKLYQGAASTWTDVSRVGDYTTGEKRWRFSQFGDVTMATNGIDPIQFSTGVDFADIAGAPAAKLMDVAQGFVMVADTNDGVFGDQSDRWWCSALYDYSDWTPDVATQATSGRLFDAPGPLRAMRALGSNFVAYKDRAMWIGQYVGPPNVWQWTQIPGEVGCSSQEAVVNIGTAHFFIGYEDIYIYDGSRPQSIGEGIKEWFFENLNTDYRSNIRGLHDSPSSTVWFFFPKTDSGDGTPNAALVYNYRAGKWGLASITMDAAVEYLEGGVTYDGLGSEFSTYDDLPNISYDSPLWTAFSPSPAVVNPDGQLQTLVGDPLSPQMTMGDVGDDARYSTLRRVRLRFIQTPVSATMQNSYKYVEGDTLTNDQSSTMEDGKFDVMRSARFHRVSFTFGGNVELSMIDYDLQPDGTR